MSEFDPERTAAMLGPDGPGYDVYPDFVDEVACKTITEELAQPGLPYYEDSGPTTGSKGQKIEQVFRVFAHKISRGEQETIKQLPAFLNLANLVTKKVVEPLATYYPSLTDWDADEITAQQYPVAGGKLGWHKDNARHPGLIGTITTEGRGRLGLRTNGNLHIVETEPGLGVFMRAPGLFPSISDIRVLHTLMEVVGDEPRTSVTVRANNLPDEQIREFVYYNWPATLES